MISVLLPYRNAAPTLDEAVASVRADLGPADEVVLVDDSSTDAGPEIAARHARDDHRVIRVTGPGRGIVAALGRGLDACRGVHIARMDADDVTLPGRFAAQRALLDASPDLGAVAVRVALFGAPGPGMERYVAWQNTLLTAAEHARAIFIEAPICHPATMLRRAALDAVGGFRKGDFAEDYDLWLRLVAAGWGIAKLPAVLFRWRIHAASLTWNDDRVGFDKMRRLRARYLAAELKTVRGEGPLRPFALWGAGQCGRRLARELEAHDLRPEYFIDIDPKKIGRTARGRAIVAMDPGIARARDSGFRIVVAVAAAGARDLVRARLDGDGWVEGRDYVCAA